METRCWDEEDSTADLLLPLPELTDLEALLLDTESDGSFSSASASPLPLDSCGEYSSTGSDGSISPVDSPSAIHDSPDGSHFPLFDDQSTDAEEQIQNQTKRKRCRRPKSQKTPLVRAKETKRKRNERERRRVKKISEAFNNLKSAVPFSSDDKKLSKLDTLKNALSYIHNLGLMLEDDDRRRSERETAAKSTTALDVKPLVQAPLLASPFTVQLVNGAWSYYQLVTFPVGGFLSDSRLAAPGFGGYSQVLNGFGAMKA